MILPCSGTKRCPLVQVSSPLAQGLRIEKTLAPAGFQPALLRMVIKAGLKFWHSSKACAYGQWFYAFRQPWITPLAQGHTSLVRGCAPYLSNANTAASGMIRGAEHVTGEKLNFVFRTTIYAQQYIHEFGSFTDANDASVVMTGENMDGTSASTGDKFLAGIFIALPVSGKGVGAALSGFLKNGDELASGLKVLGDNKKSLRIGAEGSASTKFSELISEAGGSLDDVM